jgi:ribosomal protein L6P/L9E
MSRLAKQPIVIPAKTEVSVSNGEIMVKGPKGTLKRAGNRLVLC